MFNLKIENTSGQMLTLTQNESDFQVYDIEGLNPPKAQINVATIAGMDGAQFKSSKLEPRNLVLYIKLNGDVERNRIRLYSYFPTGMWCKVYYKNGTRDVYVEGYIETNEVTPFSENETMQVSIVCPNPYFKGVDEIVDDISKVVKRFVFPFSINLDEPIPFSELETNLITTVINASESETGLIIDCELYGNINSLEIRNVVTGEKLKVVYNFKENDRLFIDCNKGSKRITLTRDGVESNLIPYLVKSSVFFQLRTGDNNFSYLADDGSSDHLVSILFKHYNVFRGV